MFSLVLFSCTKENPAEFNQKTTEAHQIEFTEVTVPESGGNVALTMDVSSKTEGVIFYTVSSIELPLPDAFQLISKEISALNNGEFNVTSDSHVYNDTLAGFPKYYVYSVVRNIYDEITPVVVDTVVVNDITSPFLLSDVSNPVSGTETTTSPIIELAFNEAVFMGDTFGMEITGIKLIEGDLPEVETSFPVSKDMITIEKNIVKIDLSKVLLNCGNMVVVSALQGSFKDESNNASEKISWHHDGDEFISIDYHFTAKSYDVNEAMLGFIGENTFFTFIDGKMSGSSRTHNVEIQDCSESTVLLVGVFGVHDDLEFTFNLDEGSISFDTFETSVYYDEDEEDGGFKVGDPVGLTQHRVYFKPEQVGQSGESGEFSVANNTFYVSYGIYVGEFSKIGTVLDNYSKVADVNTSSASKRAKTSSVISSKYAEMIEKFRTRK